MKLTFVPIVISALVIVTKGFEKGLKDIRIGRGVEISQKTSLLRSARILRRVLET